MLNTIKMVKINKKAQKGGKDYEQKALKLEQLLFLHWGQVRQLYQKRTKRDEQRKATKDIQKEHIKSFTILKEGNILRIVRGYITLMVTMKHLQDRKTRRS